MDDKELLEISQYLAFNLEKEVFAFDISKVKEVLEFTALNL